ncbi:MAG: type II toxin-antitoxin system HigB family toxin [Phycisphaeraceae bacterium]
MNVIKPTRIREYWARYRRAKTSLEDWLKKTRAARWSDLTDVRRTFSSADPVKVASGRRVVVFNIGGGNYRLITAIHYNRGNVYVLRFLTHADYDKDRWKDEL